MTFRLIAAAVLSTALLSAAPQTRAKNATNDPDLKEMRDYRLNMDVLQKYVNAYKAAMSDQKAQACFKNSPPGNAPTLDKGEKMITDCTAAVAALKSAGLKPREFLIITAQLIGDMMAVEMKKQGTIKEYPPAISPENAAFFEQNFDKIKVLIAPLMNGGDK